MTPSEWAISTDPLEMLSSVLPILAACPTLAVSKIRFWTTCEALARILWGAGPWMLFLDETKQCQR